MKIFERAYGALLGRVGRGFLFASGATLVVASVLRSTLAYGVELASLSVALLAGGGRIITLNRALKIALPLAAIASAVELFLGLETLRGYLLAANLASIVILSVNCSTPAFVSPSAMGALIFASKGEALYAALSLLLAPLPLVVRWGVARLSGLPAALCLFSGYLRSVVIEDASLFERECGPLLSRKKLSIHIFSLRGTSRELLLLVSDVHPGPFAGVGGALLVDALIREAKSSGRSVIFLHGIGSHENDPISRRQVHALVEKIFERAASLEHSKTRALRPLDIVEGKARVFALHLGVGPPLAVVSRAGKGMDDVPSDAPLVGSRGGLVVVEAQNGLGVEVDEELLGDIARGIERIRASLSPCSTFRAGFSEVPTEAVDPLGRELGPAGISALALECGDIRAGLVVIDGNNLDRGVYDRIVDRLKPLVDVVEVVTTDNHARVGWGGKRGYRVVGETIDAKTLSSACETALSRALSSLSDVEAAYSVLEIEMEVLGERGYELLARVAAKWKAVALFLMTLSAATLVPAIWAR
ncbi:MAG: DUF2070 family protein [Fervidicoccaceae archaeon]